MQILGDAGAFVLHRPLMLDALALLNLRSQFNRAFFNLPVKLVIQSTVTASKHASKPTITSNRCTSTRTAGSTP